MFRIDNIHHRERIKSSFIKIENVELLAITGE